MTPNVAANSSTARRPRRVVFRNAAVALRVVDDEVLDNTRIHPDNYVQVLEVVANALDYDFDQLKAAAMSVQRKS